MANDPVRVEGLDELLHKLEALPREMAGRNGGPVRSALFKAATVVRDEARNRAPVRSGLLRDNIVAKRNRNPGEHDATEEYGVGVAKGSKKKYANTRKNRRQRKVGEEYTAPSVAFYWRFLEFGTAKLAARPFLRPAFEQTKERALGVFKTELAAGIDRIVRKLGQ